MLLKYGGVFDACQLFESDSMVPLKPNLAIKARRDPDYIDSNLCSLG